MSHRFVWVDIPVRDLDRAIAFYSALLGVQVTREAGPGFSFGLLPHEDGEVGGCLVLPEGEDAPSTRGPLVYLNVEGRLDAALEAAAARGGQVLQPPHPLGPFGFRALLLDSEGNRVAVHSMAR
ncbi:MAG TPA: VOC family protein [Holophaga sp.]|nr:VOC family protein [Holophaga sp.]